MHVLASNPLRNEPDGVACGERDVRDGRKLVGDLGGGVARTNDNDPFASVGGWVVVVGDMREFGGEALLTGEGGAVGARKRSSGRDDPSGSQLLAVSRYNHELTVFPADAHHAGVGLDLDV